MTRLSIVLSVAVAGLTWTTFAQDRQIVVNGDVVQMGPQGRQFKTGTGRIRGRVISSETGTAIRRAQVRLSGNETAPRAALTDAQGRYEFTELPEGRFTVMASKSGFVTVQYGQTRPYESGRTIELADKQVLERADIFMPRGSVISGRIVDEFGEPVADASVSAMRQTWAGGRRRMLSAGRFAQTNDLGQFRLYGLPPGDYYVSATLRNTDVMMFDMMAMGSPPPPPGSTPSSGYAPTYFPGTASLAEAQRITVAAGQEVQGTDFALMAVKLARVSGIVLNSEGKPSEGVMISATPARGPEGGLPFGMTARTNRDGAFTMAGVAPGDYVLQTRAVTITTSNVGESMSFSTRVVGPVGDAEFGVLPVTVGGEDLNNVIINTTRGATATGHVTFDSARAEAISNLRVMSTSTDLDTAPIGGGPGALVKPDGSFELKGLFGGRLLRLIGLPNGLALKSVQVNGTDLTDTGIEFKGTDTVSGIEIVVSTKNTVVTGSVTDSSGATIKDYTVVMFSEDPQKWTVPATRWVTGTRPDQEGRFRIANLPPGAYLAIAVEYMPQGEWGDPEILDRLKSKATRVSLGEGENKTLEMKLTSAY